MASYWPSKSRYLLKKFRSNRTDGLDAGRLQSFGDADVWLFSLRSLTNLQMFPDHWLYTVLFVWRWRIQWRSVWLKSFGCSHCKRLKSLKKWGFLRWLPNGARERKSDFAKVLRIVRSIGINLWFFYGTLRNRKTRKMWGGGLQNTSFGRCFWWSRGAINVCRTHCRSSRSARFSLGPRASSLLAFCYWSHSSSKNSG